MPKHCLILANGDLNPGPAVQQALQDSGPVIAADGGAEFAAALGLAVDLLIGDMDSVSPQTLARLQMAGTEVRRFPVDKNETDLELALLAALADGAESIRILGGVGGRLDQTLANIYLLNLPALAALDVRLVSGAQSLCLMRPGDYAIEGQIGDTISLIPLGGPVEGISTQGLRYPLQDETLAFGPARGVSNRISQLPARLQTRSGILLFIQTQGEAP
jgi:thiamine pyrophosphokinase